MAATSRKQYHHNDKHNYYPNGQHQQQHRQQQKQSQNQNQNHEKRENHNQYKQHQQHHHYRCENENEYDDIALSEIVLLSLPRQYILQEERMQKADAVLRDLRLLDVVASETNNISNAENKTETEAVGLIPEAGVVDKDKPDEDEDNNDNDKAKLTNIRKKIQPRIRYAMSVAYEGDPDMLLGTIETFIKVHGAKQLDFNEKRENVNSAICQHCTSSEVIQVQKLAESTAWRQAFMREIRAKLDNSQI